jgi:hypothetical protein
VSGDERLAHRDVDVGELLGVLAQALGDIEAILCRNPARLYGF